MINIYFSVDSELSEYEAISKGYRVDVYVEINGPIYNLRIYTIIRLQQDFESEIEANEFYLPDPNIVLVKSANRLEIINTINFLYDCDYFSSIKPIDDTDTMLLTKIQ